MKLLHRRKPLKHAGAVHLDRHEDHAEEFEHRVATIRDASAGIFSLLSEWSAPLVRAHFRHYRRSNWIAAALCLLTPDMQNRRIIDAVFERVRRRPRAAIETNSVVALCSHVRFGNWSSIVPHTFPRLFPSTEGMLQIKLVAPSASQKIGLVVADRTPVSPLARSLLSVARGVRI